MPVAVGDAVDDFTFVKADGTPFELRTFRGKPVLLIFLRHLA